MALSITQENNTIFLKGRLNTETFKNFKAHFNFITNSQKNMTLNIDKVTEIDEATLYALKDMYKNAVLNYNIFFVEGQGSEAIYESFKYPLVA